MAGRKKSLYGKLKNKYRLVIQRDTTYEEVWFMRLSRLNVLTVISSSILLVTIIVVALIVYTPLKELIPGYPSGEMTRNIRLNALKLDSGIRIILPEISKVWSTQSPLISKHQKNFRRSSHPLKPWPPILTLYRYWTDDS